MEGACRTRLIPPTTRCWTWQARATRILRELLDELYQEEQRISYRRRVLHGKIDILRAELVRRLKGEHEAGSDVITGRDVELLIDILANDLRGVSRFDVTGPVDDEEWEEPTSGE